MRDFVFNKRDRMYITDDIPIHLRDIVKVDHVLTGEPKNKTKF